MFLNSRNILLALILFSAMLPLLAFSAGVVPEKSVEVHLDADVKVGGDQVVLGDVATIYARNLQHFKALAGLVISRIPDDKQEVRLPGSYLEARVRAALPEGTDFALRAPKEIVFRLERVGLGATELAGEISRLGRVAGKIPEGVEAEILPLTGLEILAGWKLATTRIEPQGELQQWKGELSFKLTRTDQPAASPLWVRTKVRWFQQAWVAKKNFGLGASLDAASFERKRVETTALREELVNVGEEELPALLASSRLKRSLASENALVPSMLDRKPDAQAGSALRVVFVSESGVRVSADGSLLAPGTIGGDVKARLRSSKKIVTGKLVSQGLVEVSL